MNYDERRNLVEQSDYFTRDSILQLLILIAGSSLLFHNIALGIIIYAFLVFTGKGEREVKRHLKDEIDKKKSEFERLRKQYAYKIARAESKQEREQYANDFYQDIQDQIYQVIQELGHKKNVGELDASRKDIENVVSRYLNRISIKHKMDIRRLIKNQDKLDRQDINKISNEIESSVMSENNIVQSNIDTKHGSEKEKSKESKGLKVKGFANLDSNFTGTEQKESTTKDRQNEIRSQINLSNKVDPNHPERR